jgi:hypothetical protein
LDTCLSVPFAVLAPACSAGVPATVPALAIALTTSLQIQLVPRSGITTTVCGPPKESYKGQLEASRVCDAGMHDIDPRDIPWLRVRKVAQ